LVYSLFVNVANHVENPDLSNEKYIIFQYTGSGFKYNFNTFGVMVIIKNILELIIVLSGFTCLLSLVVIIRQRLISSKLSNLNLGNLPIKRTEFGQLILDWCHDNFGLENIKKPTLTLRYYRTKQVEGIYYPQKNECVIYCPKELGLIEFTNSILHEYTHARQKCKGFNKMYERYNKTHGYEQNPYEIEARDFASKYQDECLRSVLGQIPKIKE
jgi:hypothetical protein